jgi:hypothetical protein
MTLTRTLAATLTVAALAVPAAQAQATDRNTSVGQSKESTTQRSLPGPPTWPVNPQPITTTPDLDSATRRPLPGPPTWPVNPQPIGAAPASEVTDRDSGPNWTAIALGIAGSLLAMSGLAALATHRTRRAQRPGSPA